MNKKRKLDDMTDLRDALNFELMMDKFLEINKKLDYLINKMDEIEKKYNSLEERVKPNNDCNYIS